MTRGRDAPAKEVGMLEAVTAKTEELAEICLKHRVKRLAVFG